MGEYGGRAGEPTGARGVGGIKVNAGKTSVGTRRSEDDVPTVFNFAQLAVRFRASMDWKCRCSGSSTPEIYDIVDCMSDLVVFI